MPPAADDDDLPSDEEDVETAKPVPPIKGMAKAKDGEGVTEPLLSDGGGGKQAASDSSPRKPSTPREKMRQKSVTTPRDKAGAPAAAHPEEAAIAMAQQVASDPKAAAAAALEAAKNVKLPTKEELAAAGAANKAEAAAALEQGKALLKDMMADAPPSMKKQDTKKMEAYLDSLGGPEAGGAGGAISALKPCLLMTISFFMACGPWMGFVWKWGSIIWKLLPKNMVTMIFGATLCYFGGTYVASIAAIEAFRTMGFEKARKDLADVWVYVEKVQAVSVEDDAVDDDGDGIADVDQISPSELVRRKIELTMCARPL